MPYISKQSRAQFSTELASLIYRLHQNPEIGNLNYVITTLCDAYLDFHDRGPKYADLNAVIGVLESAKLELYRRRVAPYEDQKRQENGDAYNIFSLDDRTSDDDNWCIE